MFSSRTLPPSQASRSTTSANALMRPACTTNGGCDASTSAIRRDTVLEMAGGHLVGGPPIRHETDALDRDVPVRLWVGLDAGMSPMRSRTSWMWATAGESSTGMRSAA